MQTQDCDLAHLANIIVGPNIIVGKKKLQEPGGSSAALEQLQPKC